jgi:uncharacterized protein
MRIVVDTNVFISAFFWGGKPKAVLERAIEGVDDLFVSKEILNELYSVLRKPKFGLDERHIDYYVRAIEDISTLIAAPALGEGASRDRTDDKILACALAAHSQFLITGDEDLLVLGDHRGVLILDPASYLDSIAGLQV